MITDSLWEPHCPILSTRIISLYPGNLNIATEWAVTGYAESLRQQLVGTGIRGRGPAVGGAGKPAGVGLSEIAIRAVVQDF